MVGWVISLMVKGEEKRKRRGQEDERRREKGRRERSMRRRKRRREVCLFWANSFCGVFGSSGEGSAKRNSQRGIAWGSLGGHWAVTWGFTGHSWEQLLRQLGRPN